MAEALTFWNDASRVARAATICSMITIIAPFLFGILALVFQSRAGTLKDLALQHAHQRVAFLERQAEPRRVDETQAQGLAFSLARITPERTVVSSCMMDGEGLQYAQDLAQRLKELGWYVLLEHTRLDPLPPGLHIGRLDGGIHLLADHVIKGFRNAGFAAEAFTPRPRSIAGPKEADGSELVIAIGAKI